MYYFNIVEDGDMVDSNRKMQWAKKVSHVKIRKLYENDAKGIIDDELIDEVGYGLYARCESILIVTEAHFGKVKCPCCNNIVLRICLSNKEEIIKCNLCSWEIKWDDYHSSYKNKQLFGNKAVDVFKYYINKFPNAKTPPEKILVIDNLIHEFHIVLLHSGSCQYGRPVIANLIDSKLLDVINFLNNLTYSDNSDLELSKTQTKWRNKLETISWVKQGLDADSSGNHVIPIKT